ncbi:MAG TPA: DNA alkylation repair protein [Planctomycetota bacterium]|nr:DNA alkylation repair protein [Planctomycetota bacterium]
MADRLNLQQLLARLEALGKERQRRVYARHGVKSPMFGVAHAELYRLQRQLGQDHILAQALWDSGNHDARVLATLVADPLQLAPIALDRWLRDIDDRPLCTAFVALAARSPQAQACAQRWIETSMASARAAGWGVFTALARDAAVSDAAFVGLLPLIGARIHGAPNRVRHAMNGCLIAIGCRPTLRPEALQVAGRVGAVEVDHGDTDCKTPVAFDYIQKVAARQGQKASSGGKGAGPRPQPAKARGTSRKQSAAKRR